MILAAGRDTHVSNSKKLALIAIGYVLSVVVGFAAAAVNEALMPDDVAQGSPGMVACAEHGDTVFFASSGIQVDRLLHSSGAEPLIFLVRDRVGIFQPFEFLELIGHAEADPTRLHRTAPTHRSARRAKNFAKWSFCTATCCCRRHSSS